MVSSFATIGIRWNEDLTVFESGAFLLSIEAAVVVFGWVRNFGATVGNSCKSDPLFRGDALMVCVCGAIAFGSG